MYFSLYSVYIHYKANSMKKGFLSILFTEKSPATKTILTHINNTFLPLISTYRISSFRIKDLKTAITNIITKKEIELTLWTN